LFAIGYSPWSERARFALIAQGVPFEERAYIPMLTEPRVRWALGRPFRQVTVPVLLREDGPPLDDSLDIALWGSERGTRPLARSEDHDAIRHWNGVASRLIELGRILTTLAVLDDPTALRASLPPIVLAAGPLALPIGGRVARQTLTKYPVAQGLDRAALLDGMRTELDALRAGLDGRDTLLGSLSYADITAAVGLSFVRPRPELGVAEAALGCWTRDALLDPYADLLAWRDHVYQHRRPPSP
jgi:glutathione S-transferase